MLWRLVRIDPSFVWTLRCAAFSAAIALVGNRFGPVLLAAAYWGMMGVVLNLAGFHRRAAAYQLALPLPARTVWLSRLICFTVLFWLPALFQLRYGWRVLAAALAPNLLHAMLCAYHPRRDVAPVWWLVLSLLVFLAVLIPLMMYPVPWLLAAMALVIAVLYGWAWSRVAESFQVADEEPVDWAPSGMESGPLRDNWFTGQLPFLRSFVAWQPLILLVIIPLQTLNIRHGEAAFGVVFVPSLMMHLATALDWMNSTPVSRRRIFAWILGVPLAAFVLSFVVLGFVRGGTIGVMPVDDPFLAASFTVAMLLLALIIPMAIHQSTFAWLLLPKSVRMTAFIVQFAVLVPLLVPWIDFRPGKTLVSPIAHFVLLLSRQLPQQPWLLLGICVTMLLATYLFTEKVFVDSEGLRPIRKGDRGFWR